MEPDRRLHLISVFVVRVQKLPALSALAFHLLSCSKGHKGAPGGIPCDQSRSVERSRLPIILRHRIGNAGRVGVHEQTDRWTEVGLSFDELDVAATDDEEEGAVAGGELGVDGAGFGPGEVAGAVLVVVVEEVAFDDEALFGFVVAVGGVDGAGGEFDEGGDEGGVAGVDSSMAGFDQS